MCGSVFRIRTRIQEASEYGSNPDPKHWEKENIILEFFKTDYELSKIHVLVPVHIGPNLGLL